MLSDSKETKLGSSNQEVSPSADNNTGIVLVPCCARKCVLTAISGGVDRVSFVMTDKFSVRVTKKITSRIGFS